MSGGLDALGGMRRIKTLVTKVGSGKTPNGGAQSYRDDGIVFLRSQNVHFGGLRLDDVAFIGEEVHREMATSRVLPGDVLLNITGASLGRVARVPDSFGEANVNQHVCIIRPGARVDGRFLAYALASSNVQEQISALQVGGNRDGLNFEQVGNLAIPLPPNIGEQRRIADFLDAKLASVDALAKAKARQIALLDERGEAIVASRVAELVGDYGSVPLRRIWSGIEQGWSPQCDDAEADPDDWAVLRTSAVSTGRFNPLAHKRLPVDIQPDLRYVINDGDLLLTRGSGSPAMVGVAVVADTGGRRLLLSDLLYRVRLQPGWPGGLVASVMGSRPAREQISLLLRGQSGQTIKLRGQDVGEILIPRVPIDCRASIAAEIAATSAGHASAAKEVGNSLLLLQERRRALVTAAVTGRLDVTAARGAVA